MSEALIPTTALRIVRRRVKVSSIAAWPLSEMRYQDTLQQMFWRGNEQVWIDVPIVEDPEHG